MQTYRKNPIDENFFATWVERAERHNPMWGAFRVIEEGIRRAFSRKPNFVFEKEDKSICAVEFCTEDGTKPLKDGIHSICEYHAAHYGYNTSQN